MTVASLIAAISLLRSGKLLWNTFVALAKDFAQTVFSFIFRFLYSIYQSFPVFVLRITTLEWG